MRSALAIVCAVAVIFWSSLKIPFLLDDYQIYIDYWPQVSVAAFWHDVSNHFQQNRWLTHATWYAQMIAQMPGPYSPQSFHFLNITFHAINSILVWTLTGRLGASRQAAFLAAFLFAVHPSNMESVSYIYGRSDLLVTGFILAALWMLSEFPRRAVLSVFLMTAAVATKETAVVLPALYIGIALLLKPPKYRFSRSALGLTVLVSAASLAGFILLKTDHADNFGYGFPNALRYLMLQPFCLFLGLARLIVPTGFYIVYQFDLPSGLLDPKVWAPVLVWAGLMALSIRQYRSGRRVYLFALIWYLAAMAPTNSVVPRIDQISDRHLYLALIGPMMALAFLTEAAVKKYGVWIQTIAWMFVAACAGLTVMRNIEWQSAIKIWAKASDRFPNSYLARRELASEWGRAGDASRELAELEKVTRAWPEDWTSWNNLGVAYAGFQKREEERHAYLQAIARAPRRHLAMLQHNLAFSFQLDNHIDSAVETYRRALDSDPDYAGSKHNLALLLWQRGRGDEAEKLLREILEKNPHHSFAQRSLEKVASRRH